MDEATLTKIRTRIERLDANQAAIDLLKRLQSRARQELSVRLEDKTKPVLDDLKDRVARRIWMLGQKWSNWGDDEPILYPTGPSGGTRLFYKKGDTSVMIYDQAPQVRSVTFHPDLIRRDADEPNRKFYFNLGFPYVVFMIHYIGGRYQATYVFYLKEPLKSVHQKPLVPSLPNIDKTTMKVCHGDFNHAAFKVGDYASMTHGAIDHFWRSEFNGNWTEGYHAAQRIEPRMATPRKWEAATKGDPMFPLSVAWQDSPYPTFRHLMTRLFEADKKVQESNQALFMDLVSETTTELLTLLEGQKDVEDPAVAESLRKTLASLISDMVDPS